MWGSYCLPLTREDEMCAVWGHSLTQRPATMSFKLVPEVMADGCQSVHKQASVSNVRIDRHPMLYNPNTFMNSLISITYGCSHCLFLKHKGSGVSSEATNCPSPPLPHRISTLRTTLVCPMHLRSESACEWQYLSCSCTASHKDHIPTSFCHHSLWSVRWSYWGWSSDRTCVHTYHIYKFWHQCVVGCV